ncbi:MAG: hypothetical protein M0R75_01575 [Dehalococcoidia bacterium]|nr:hypothetical protein [Dehalococcoidia bacterium]
MTIQEQQAALGAAGYQTQLDGDQLLVRNSYGERLGYLVDGDNGRTGTCRGIHKRQGSVAAVLRKAQG